MWTAIKKLLPFNIKKLGLGQVLELNEICDNWDKIPEEILGEPFKNKARPISLKNKILIVDCMNSSWAGELQLRQGRLIKYINNLFGKELVDKIKFIS
jgi:predicted nucleic acid-binding Zn ribbon protein